jgi:single-strand DNA-binding protein
MNAVIILEGNVVRKPELRRTTKGTAVCTVSVGVNRWFKSREGALEKEASFFDVEAWGALAGACAEKCDKGRSVRVVGRLQQDRWVDGEGKNKSKEIIVADHVAFGAPREKSATNPTNQPPDVEADLALEDETF